MGRYQIIPDRQGGFDVYWQNGRHMELVAAGFDSHDEAQEHITELIGKMRDAITGSRQNASG